MVQPYECETVGKWILCFNVKVLFDEKPPNELIPVIDFFLYSTALKSNYLFIFVSVERKYI